MFNSNNFGFQGGCMEASQGMQCPPIVEPGCETVINRQINHQVPHILPMHTRYVNHHIYHHSYIPHCTCSEENIICNVYGPNPCCK